MTASAVPGALSAACPQVSLAGPGDAVAGIAPRYVAAPAGLDQAAAVLAAAAAEGLSVVPRGTGTRLSWGSPPRSCDLVVDTRRMNQVLEHAAGDQVVAVQAGLTLSQLRRSLAPAGQRLALDPPGGGSAGGVLATGVAGPLRLRYGAGRDLLIGITVVRADGTVARSGGKVVKNVAGYDLGKLFAGSFGTLGLIAEATFRLHPSPGAARYVTADCADGSAAADAVATAVDSPLAPSAAEIDRPARGAPVRVGVLLEGDPGGVAERSAQLADLLSAGAIGGRRGGAAAVSAAPPPWWGRSAPAAQDGTAVQIAFWAGELAAVLAAVDAAAGAAALDPVVSGSAAAGVIDLAVDAAAAPAAVAQFVAGLRAGITSAVPLGSSGQAGGPAWHGSAVVRRAPAPLHQDASLWGPVPSLSLMRAVKDQFDPGHRMAPGRFAGGI